MCTEGDVRINSLEDSDGFELKLLSIFEAHPTVIYTTRTRMLVVSGRMRFICQKTKQGNIHVHTL